MTDKKAKTSTKVPFTQFVPAWIMANRKPYQDKNGKQQQAKAVLNKPLISALKAYYGAELEAVPATTRAWTANNLPVVKTLAGAEAVLQHLNNQKVIDLLPVKGGFMVYIAGELSKGSKQVDQSVQRALDLIAKA